MVKAWIMLLNLFQEHGQVDCLVALLDNGLSLHHHHRQIMQDHIHHPLIMDLVIMVIIVHLHHQNLE